MAQQPQPEEAHNGAHPRKNGGVPIADGVSNQGAGAGTPHFLINIGVGHHVERVRGRRPQPPTNQREEDQQNVVFPTLGLKHGGDGGNKEKFNDPRFCQRDIGLDRLHDILQLK